MAFQCYMEPVVLGGMAATAAGLFTNPLEVVKIRMQLQGELKARGQYAVHYRNVFHAFYTIGKREGILALQKGLIPALSYQFIMNGIRLGLYHVGSDQGWTRKQDGSMFMPGSILLASCTGTLGAACGSPFFLVKTRLQSHADDPSIAVGKQHNYTRVIPAFKDIYREYGVRGLWSGCSSSVPRIIVASAVQLPTFDASLRLFREQRVVPNTGGFVHPFMASMVAGLFVSFLMAPFDMMATRFYNQAYDANGKGLMYKNIVQCGIKIAHAEGISGFFKGWTANYFRLGPHTLLSLMFWDALKRRYAEPTCIH